MEKLDKATLEALAGLTNCTGAVMVNAPDLRLLFVAFNQALDVAVEAQEQLGVAQARNTELENQLAQCLAQETK